MLIKKISSFFPYKVLIQTELLKQKTKKEFKFPDNPIQQQKNQIRIYHSRKSKGEKSRRKN